MAKPFNFLGLPLELRQDVYRYVLNEGKRRIVLRHSPTRDHFTIVHKRGRSSFTGCLYFDGPTSRHLVDFDVLSKLESLQRITISVVYYRGYVHNANGSHGLKRTYDCCRRHRDRFRTMQTAAWLFAGRLATVSGKVNKIVELGVREAGEQERELGLSLADCVFELKLLLEAIMEDGQGDGGSSEPATGLK